MDENSLLSIRVVTMATQTKMAEAMGVPLRTYEDLETGKSKTRPIHLIAARMAGAKLAVEAADPSGIPLSMVALAEAIVTLRSSAIRLFYGDGLEKRFDSYEAMLDFAGRIGDHGPVNYALVEATGKTIQANELDLRFLLS